MSISDWPEDERPREKLLQHGATVLSEAELLAIFLRVGVTGKSAVDLARELLQTFGGINGLLQASLPEASRVKGFGPAKYAQLQATLELARRSLREPLQYKAVFSHPATVKKYLQLSLAHLPIEQFHGLFLDAQLRLIAHETLAQGTLDKVSLHPREVVRRALALNASAVLFAHNHPSGNAQASAEDIEITTQLQQALALFEIRLLDHWIVSGVQVVSLRDLGLFTTPLAVPA